MRRPHDPAKIQQLRPRRLPARAGVEPDCHAMYAPRVAARVAGENGRHEVRKAKTYEQGMDEGFRIGVCAVVAFVLREGCHVNDRDLIESFIDGDTITKNVPGYESRIIRKYLRQLKEAHE